MPTIDECITSGEAHVALLRAHKESDHVVVVPPDITAPDTMIVGFTQVHPWDTHYVLTLEGADDSAGPFTFKGHLDDEPWHQVAATVTLDVGVGDHVYEASAIDAAGNTDPTPAVVKWTVIQAPDVTEPVTILVSGPPAVTSEPTITIAVTATDDRPGPLTYEAKGDDAPWTVFIPPLVLSQPQVGTHEVLISAVDAAGNRDTSPLSVAWTQVAVEPPTPPAQGENPMLIDDGGVGLARDAVYHKMIPWKNAIGDFTDATGAKQGTAAFSTVNVSKGQTTVARVDATSLVKSFATGEDIQICVRASAIMTFKARSYGADGPQLEVVYTDNKPDLLPAIADAECNPSTAAPLGGNATLGLSYNGKSYIRFAAPKKPVGKATLVLSPYNINEAGRVNLFKFAVHLDKMASTAYAPVASPFFETECFARDDLEPKGYLPTYWGIFGDPAHFRPGDDWNQRNIVTTDDGGKALQITFDPRGSSALNSSIPFPGYLEADEAEWQFEIKMLSDLLVGARDGFKLFAGVTSKTKSDDTYFCGWSGAGQDAIGTFGTLLAGNGGSKAHGYDGWSLRWDSWNSPPAGHPMRGRFLPMQYAYHPEQSDYYGDGWSWLGQNTAMVVDTWHLVKMRAKINTVLADGTAPKNAEFDGWLDQAPVLRKRDFRLRTTLTPLIGTPGTPGVSPYYGVKNTKLSLGRIWLNTYHGGTSTPSARCSFQVRNMKVGKIA